MTVIEETSAAGELLKMQVARTIDVLRRHRGFSDRQLGERAGMSRPAVEARRRGATACSVEDLAKLAIGLGVEPEVFLLDPDDALRWLLDHAPRVLGESWAARGSNPEPTEIGPDPVDVDELEAAA